MGHFKPLKGKLRLPVWLHLTLAVAFSALLLPVSTPVAAGPLSDYVETGMIKHWFQNDATTPSRPTTLYVGLSTTACSDSATGTEVSTTGTAYARVGLTANSTNWTGPTTNDGTVKNGAAVTYSQATADWGTVTHFFIIDSASGAGNIIVCSALTNPRNITTGAQPSFAINSLSVQFDN